MELHENRKVSAKQGILPREQTDSSQNDRKSLPATFRQRSNIQNLHKVKKLNSKGTKLPTNKRADEPNLEFL